MNSWSDADEAGMWRALGLARQAESLGEVPIGAVVTFGGEILGEGWNRPISSHDPTSHAEVEAIRAATARIGNYRLPRDSTLYVTLEPCIMCVGAIVLARLERLVFAARDLRFGAVRSKFALADSPLLNHRIKIEEGLLAAETGEMLGTFFGSKRGPRATANTKGQAQWLGLDKL